MDRVSDNFKDFPARMSDGRAFTDYKANCMMNKKISGETDSYEYRQKLITNADDLLNKLYFERTLLSKP